MTTETALEPAFQNPYATVYRGNCLDVMRTMPDASISAVVTDPPYGLATIDEAKIRQALHEWGSGNDEFVPSGKGFMNKRWDEFVPPPAVWREALRVLEPGGQLLCFAGSRTLDLMMYSIRSAGFVIDDTVEWMYGSGMPKSLDVARGIDKTNGFVGEVVGTEQVDIGMQGGQLHAGRSSNVVTREVRALSDEAAKWKGWGTALKPSREPIIHAHKPLDVDDVPPPSIPAFVYMSKAKRSERPVTIDDEGNSVMHPTVKPLDLMRALLDHVVPVKSVVLDPFLGSGTTCEAQMLRGGDSIGIELDDDGTHMPLIVERLTGHDIWTGDLLEGL